MKMFKISMLLIALTLIFTSCCSQYERSVLDQLSEEEVAMISKSFTASKTFEETYAITRETNKYITSELDKAKFSALSFNDLHSFRAEPNAYITDADRVLCIEYITIYDNIGKNKPKEEESSSDYFN